MAGATMEMATAVAEATVAVVATEAAEDAASVAVAVAALMEAEAAVVVAEVVAVAVATATVTMTVAAVVAAAVVVGVVAPITGAVVTWVEAAAGDLAKTACKSSTLLTTVEAMEDAAEAASVVDMEIRALQQLARLPIPMVAVAVAILASTACIRSSCRILVTRLSLAARSKLSMLATWELTLTAIRSWALSRS